MPEPDLVAMRDAMMHRGPDDAGSFLAPGIALGSRRLAIVDLSSNGHMPMQSADGRYTIVYNGEVYNYPELRSALVSAGCRFRSNTDTEVLLELYAREGVAMLDRLNGMFAFAVWDAQERTLLLARDRLGVKPLYYSIASDGHLAFASEAKALFAAGIASEFDPETWEELLCFRFVAGERTPFRGVRRLPPGHLLYWREGRVDLQRWWHLGERAASLRGDGGPDASAWYRTTFDDAVGLRRISDVPLGVLLSGGLDSGTVAASLATQSPPGVASFTVRFSEPRYDEGDLAAEVARRWALEPHALKVEPAGLLDRLMHAAWLNDEPLAHGNELHILAISEYARQHVTVLLSGEGADETLGGYVRYRPLAHSRVLSALRHVASPLSRYLGAGRARKLSRLMALGGADEWIIYNACDVLPRDLAAIGMHAAGPLDFRRSVLAEAKACHPDDHFRQAMYNDQHTFLGSLLDRNDRMTMGASIECRVPFLDYRLVERLASLPSAALTAGTGSKPLLRRALGDRLPAAVLKGQKWGFGVPWSRYLRTVPELVDIVRSLPDIEPACSGPFDRPALRRMIDRFIGGEHEAEPLVRQLFMIALWHRSAVRGAGTRPAAAVRS
jgi:asparagine synthase (glutamine-hydrolysing)